METILKSLTMPDIFAWTVFPAPIIVFQLLSLVFSIAIEAYIFSRKLLLTRRECIQYSVTINLMSAIALWVLGFVIQGLLPKPLKLQLISYIVLGQGYDFQNLAILNICIVLLFILIFFIVCIVEFKGLDFIEVMFSDWPESDPDHEDSSLVQYLLQALTYTDPQKISAIFWANAFSNSAILLVLLLALLQYYG
ncbi:filament integrity protein FraC [Spirulina major]|uniref:filament integrity protein FraC n=1 Tax=Spirulina major TaxID=270636 RepID=UPI001114F90B|nr:filament integrity protein FraC [Spirulina major]